MEERALISTTEQWSDNNRLLNMLCLDEELLSKHREIFSDICFRLADTIQRQKPIQDRELFDFSRTLIWMIHDTTTFLPSTFDGLFGQISDYWHFEVNDDANFKRRYSYIRLYQMVVLFQNFIHEHEQKQKAFTVLSENMQNMEIISILHRYPGVTHRKLREVLNLSQEKLQAQLNLLKSGGFLTGRRSGDAQFYMLTNNGEVLYEQLHMQERRMHITSERRELLTEILQILLYNRIKSNQIIVLFEYLQNCNNKELLQIRQQLYKLSLSTKAKYFELEQKRLAQVYLRESKVSSKYVSTRSAFEPPAHK